MFDLKSIECFVLDMDGTVYLGRRLLPGALELLELLAQRGVCYRFFTNNSSKSPEDYAEKLFRLGFGAQPRVITSGDVSADYIIKTYGAGARVYAVGTVSLVRQLEACGIVCTDETPDCVLVGFDTTFDYAKADRAVALLRAGAPYLATNIDAVCPLEDDAVLPDCASICAMLTHATGRLPKYLGKPFPETARYITAATGVPAEKTAVVGDRLYTDMRLALDNGMCAIGVLSGEMTRADVDAGPDKPHFLIESVEALCRMLA